ncbi:hypothetical protein [Streptosporangium sp. V21-05]|uniref:hypothetical protein n=1 Tax=Streptosporangium sp. V21-05 TaxID=3446115 RepID=UPI003F52CD6F
MRRAAGCALILLMATGCGASSPTLDQAAQTLAKDARKLEHLHPTVNKKVVDKTGEDGNDFTTCSEKGTAFRFHQLSGDFAKDNQYTPAQLADLTTRPLQDALMRVGYKVDRNASWVQPGRSFVILHKEDPGITFIVLVQASQPNIEVIGKTDCLPASQ